MTINDVVIDPAAPEIVQAGFAFYDPDAMILAYANGDLSLQSIQRIGFDGSILPPATDLDLAIPPFMSGMVVDTHFMGESAQLLYRVTSDTTGLFGPYVLTTLVFSMVMFPDGADPLGPASPLALVPPPLTTILVQGVTTPIPAGMWLMLTSLIALHLGAGWARRRRDM
ncbi:MAG: hypothetical protein AAF416_17615 [Pseudomonadota bacterium]